MAAATLDSGDSRLARQAALTARAMRWAIAASVVVHFIALAVLSFAHFAAPSLPPDAKLIEVKLLEPTPPAPPSPVIAAPTSQPPATPPSAPRLRAARIADQQPASVSARGAAHPRPPTPMRTAPRPSAALTPSRPGTQNPPPGLPAPQPTAPSGGERGPSSPGGGDVGLGTGSRQGDLPGGHGGGSGVVSGTGGGSGSGEGPGTGSGAVSGGGGSGASGSGTGSGPGAGGSGSAGAGGGHVSRLADRKTPALVRRVNPAYPVSAQVEGVQGTVKLLVTVTKEGKVGAAKVITSSGDARLDSAALNAVKQWKYQPAVQDGIPREVETYAAVTFSLE